MTAPSALDQFLVDRAAAYHGSVCPGLAAGIQAARLALRAVGRASEDNPVIAVAESDICAVDAIQALVGTTVGNRNLVIHDWGKNAFTFYRGVDGKAVRIAGRPAWASDYQALRAEVQSGHATPDAVARFERANAGEVARILALAPEDLYQVQEVHGAPPVTSKVDGWTTCAGCGEMVMETRTRRLRGQALCPPCLDTALAAGYRHRRRPEAIVGV
jgi:formylmethanofuran dehydrogenase subunit E